jgi:two-component system, NarL family, nitrate/nitrite response regulator NarL
MGSIRIAVIDDHPLFRAGVAQSLLENGRFEIVAEGSTHDDAVKVVADHDPDILLLDVSIPGGGLQALNSIVKQHPRQKIVMLTVSESGGDVTRAMRSGASGYVLKGVEAGSLSQILSSIAAGERYVSPALSARLLSDSVAAEQPLGMSPIDALDERQRRILDLVSSGFSNKKIAIELNLQEKTIKHQMTRIFSKLAVSNRTEAAMVFRDALRPPTPQSIDADEHSRTTSPRG